MKYSYLILSLILSFNIFPAEQKSQNGFACSSNESSAEIDDIGLDFELDSTDQSSKKTPNKPKDIPAKIQQILDEIKEHSEIGHSHGFKGANNLVFAIQHCDNEEIARCIMLAYNNPKHRLFNVNSPNKLNDDLLPLQAAFELLYDKDESTKIKKKNNFRINYPIVKLLLACNADPRKKGFYGI